MINLNLRKNWSERRKPCRFLRSGLFHLSQLGDPPAELLTGAELGRKECSQTLLGEREAFFP
jgi:hypothetical protein